MTIVYLEVFSTMNKATLISKIAEKSDLSKKQVETVLNTFIDTVLETL